MPGPGVKIPIDGFVDGAALMIIIKLCTSVHHSSIITLCTSHPALISILSTASVILARELLMHPNLAHLKKDPQHHTPRIIASARTFHSLCFVSIQSCGVGCTLETARGSGMATVERITVGVCSCNNRHNQSAWPRPLPCVLVHGCRPQVKTEHF